MHRRQAPGVNRGGDDAHRIGIDAFAKGKTPRALGRFLLCFPQRDVLAASGHERRVVEPGTQVPQIGSIMP